MNEPIYDLEEVQVRCYDLALLMKRDGISSILPERLNQKFFLHYGCDIPWKNLRFPDLPSFMDANPGFMRQAHSSGRFICLLKEDYEFTYTIPVPLSGAIPLVDLETEPDFLDPDFRYDGHEEIPLYSPYSSTARSPFRSPHHSPPRDYHSHINHNNNNDNRRRGLMANDSDSFTSYDLWAEMREVEPLPPNLRAPSPPSAKPHEVFQHAMSSGLQVSPRLMKTAASVILNLKKQKMLAEIEGQGARKAATSSRAAEGNRPETAGTQFSNVDQDYRLQTSYRAAEENRRAPAAQSLNAGHDYRPMSTRPLLAAPRIIPTSPIKEKAGYQQVQVPSTSRAAAVHPSVPPAVPVKIGQDHLPPLRATRTAAVVPTFPHGPLVRRTPAAAPRVIPTSPVTEKTGQQQAPAAARAPAGAPRIIPTSPVTEKTGAPQVKAPSVKAPAAIGVSSSRTPQAKNVGRAKKHEIPQLFKSMEALPVATGQKKDSVNSEQPDKAKTVQALAPSTAKKKLAMPKVNKTPTDGRQGQVPTKQAKTPKAKAPYGSGVTSTSFPQPVNEDTYEKTPVTRPRGRPVAKRNVPGTVVNDEQQIKGISAAFSSADEIKGRQEHTKQKKPKDPKTMAPETSDVTTPSAPQPVNENAAEKTPVTTLCSAAEEIASKPAADPVNVKSVKISRTPAVHNRIGQTSWSRVGQRVNLSAGILEADDVTSPQPVNKVIGKPPVAAEALEASDVTSSEAPVNEAARCRPIDVQYSTKRKTVLDPAAIPVNDGQPALKVQRCVNVVSAQLRKEDIPPLASPEPSSERESSPAPVSPPPVNENKTSEKDPRRITRARTIQSFRKIVNDSSKKKKEEEPVFNSAKRINLEAAVASFYAKSRPTVIVTAHRSPSRENQEKEAEKEYEISSSKETAVPSKVANFVPVETNKHAEPLGTEREKPVSFAIIQRAKTIRTTTVFSAPAVEEGEERVTVPPPRMSRAKTRPTLLASIQQPVIEQSAFAKANIFVDRIIACLKEAKKPLEVEDLAAVYRLKYFPALFYHDLNDNFHSMGPRGYDGLIKLSYGQIIMETSLNPRDRSMRYIFQLRANPIVLKPLLASSAAPSTSTFSVSAATISSSSNTNLTNTIAAKPPSTRQRSRWSSSNSSSSSRSPERKRSRTRSPGNEGTTYSSSIPALNPSVSPVPLKAELSPEAKEHIMKLLEAHMKSEPPPLLGPRPHDLENLYLKETSKESEEFSDRLVSLLASLGGHTPSDVLEIAFNKKHQESFAALCTKLLPVESPFNHLRQISNGRIEAEILNDDVLFFHLKQPIDVLFDGVVECLKKLGGVADLKALTNTFKNMYKLDFHVVCRAEFGATPFQILPDFVKMAGKFVLVWKSNWMFALSFKHLMIPARRFWEAPSAEAKPASATSIIPDVAPSLESKMSVLDIFFDRISLCLDKIEQGTTFMAVAKIYVAIYKQELLKIACCFFGSSPYEQMSEVGIQRKKFSIVLQGTFWWFKAPDGSDLKPMGLMDSISQKTPNLFTPCESSHEAHPVVAKTLRERSPRPRRGKSPPSEEPPRPTSHSRRSPSPSLCSPRHSRRSRSHSRRRWNRSPEVASSRTSRQTYSPKSPAGYNPSRSQENLPNPRASHAHSRDYRSVIRRNPEEVSSRPPWRSRRSRSRSRTSRQTYSPKSPVGYNWSRSPECFRSPSGRSRDPRSVARRNSGERSPVSSWLQRNPSSSHDYQGSHHFHDRPRQNFHRPWNSPSASTARGFSSRPRSRSRIAEYDRSRGETRGSPSRSRHWNRSHGD